MIWLALCSRREVVWMRGGCSSVLWRIVAITFLCVFIPRVFLLIQAVVWWGDQPESLINSSITAELELEKRDRFLEGVGSYREILRAKREVLTAVYSSFYLNFFSPFWIHCPIVLHQSFLPSHPSAFLSSFPSCFCHVVRVHIILLLPGSFQFFIYAFLWCVWALLQVGTWIVWLISERALEATTTHIMVMKRWLDVTDALSVIIFVLFFSSAFNYSTKNSWFVWWDLQITACLLICCGPSYCLPVLEIKLQNFAWCFGE